MTPIYLDPYFSVWLRRGPLQARVRQAAARFYQTYFPAETDRQIFSPPQQLEQFKLLWLSAALTGQDGDRFLLPLRNAISFEEWRRFAARSIR